MSPHFVQSSDTITILGGGAVDRAMLSRALALAPRLVAADGGADTALSAGLMPDAVIGDFDSISEAARQAIPEARQHRVREQDSTDFEKALRAVSAPLIVGLGFLGPRFDHALAALNALARHPDRRCVLIGERDVCFLCPPSLALTLPLGLRFSLFPLAPVTGRSEGLRWPIDGIGFGPAGRVGTSNEVTGPVRLSMDGPGMAVILPERSFEAVAEALMAAGAGGG
jgi:thiamine pyrophosphokinase